MSRAGDFSQMGRLFHPKRDWWQMQRLVPYRGFWRCSLSTSSSPPETDRKPVRYTRSHWRQTRGKYMMKGEVPFDRKVAFILNSLARQGHVEKAQHLLHRMKEQQLDVSAIHYDYLIQGQLANRAIAEAEQNWKHTRTLGIKLKPRTYEQLVSLFLEAGMKDRAHEAVLDLISVSRGESSTLHVPSALIVRLWKSGYVQMLDLLAEHKPPLPQSTPDDTLAILFLHYVRCGNTVSARSLAPYFRAELISPGDGFHDTYSIAVKLLIEEGCTAEGLNVFRRAIAAGDSVAPTVRDELLRALAQEGHVVSLQQVLETIPDLKAVQCMDTVVAIAKALDRSGSQELLNRLLHFLSTREPAPELVKVLVRELSSPRLHRQVEEWVTHAKKRQIPLGREELERLLAMYCSMGRVLRAELVVDEMEEAGLELGGSSLNSLLRMYAKLGQASKAEEVLRRLKDSCFSMSELPWNTLLRMYALTGSTARVEEMLTLGKNQSFKIEMSTLSSLLALYASIGDSSKVDELIQRRSDSSSHWPKDILQITVDMYCRLGKIFEAEQILKDHGGPSTDAVALSSILVSYCKRKDEQRVGQLLTEMARFSCVPTWQAFDAATHLYASRGDSYAVRALLEWRRACGCDATRETFRSLFRLAHELGSVRLAKEFWKAMNIAKVSPNVAQYEEMLRCLASAKDQRTIKKVMAEMGRRNIQPSVDILEDVSARLATLSIQPSDGQDPNAP